MASSDSTFSAGGGMNTTAFGVADTGFGVTLQNGGKILITEAIDGSESEDFFFRLEGRS